MKIIKDHMTAYAAAVEIAESGKTWEIQTWRMESIDGAVILSPIVSNILYLDGKEHTGSRLFQACELADFLLYPERKAINDWIRSRR